MHIAIDASRTTVQQATGTEHYALQLIRAVLNQPRQHHFTLYFRDPPTPDLFPQHDQVDFRVIPLKRAWTHLRLASAVTLQPPDLLWVPAHTLPFMFRGQGAVTVHDLGYKYFPSAHPVKTRFYLDLTTRYSARRASVVIADSQATRADLSRFYGTDASKIHVVYPGVDAPPVGDFEAVKARFHLPERYFLFVGTLQPRKNIERLVDAYLRYRQQTHDPAGLVLAGKAGWLYNPAWMQTGEGIIQTGYISDEEKGALYQNALAFVFPSLYEGFGFPVLEAMALNAPVLCSQTSSLPELVGDAAVLVDPLNVEQITQGMLQLDQDASLRQVLVQGGVQQVAKFTWEQAATDLLNALETVDR